MPHIEVVLIAVLAALAAAAMLAPKKPIAVPPPAGPEFLGSMRELPYTTPIAHAAESPAVPPEAGPCSVSITAIGPNKIQAIKTVREVRVGVGLAAAKALVENLPQPLFRDLPASDAERVRRFMALGGVSVAVEPNRSSASSYAADTNGRSDPHQQVNDLERLAQMRQSGVLTDAEFTRLKAEILGKRESLF